MVIDVVMQQMGGYELAKALAPLRPEMKVLYMSGYVEKGISQNEMSGVPFINKPFTPEALARKVREVLDGPGELGTGAVKKIRTVAPLALEFYVSFAFSESCVQEE